jgi:predicted anti-sigma-YlaC factor YlaD
MDCKRTRKKFIFYIDKELSEDDMLEVSAHLENCKECSELYNKIYESYDSVSLQQEVEPKAFFAESVLGKIDSKEKSISYESPVYDSLFAELFRKFAYTGFAVIIALVILFYVSNDVISNNSSDDDDNFTADDISTLFFDNL